MKKERIGLLLAAVWMLSLAGCNIATPGTVGTIGDIEIPAGVYLLIQYNNFTTTAQAVELEEGQSSNDVDAVLSAQATGTIGEEEITATGQEYLARLVERDLDRYAAVETAYASLGGALTQTETTAIETRVDSLWEQNGTLYEANGIGKESLSLYLTNSYKQEVLLDLYYGPDGSTPASSADLEKFVTEECIYVEGVQLPLMDYNTFAIADEDQTEQIRALAEDCVKELEQALPEETKGQLVTDGIQSVAAEYVPQVFTILGSTIDESAAAYYTISELFLPDDIAGYTLSDESNPLQDAFDEAGTNTWCVVDLTGALLAARKIDPLRDSSIEELCDRYEVLDALCGDELEERLYADGAALAHNLNNRAINIYAPSKIKRTV